MERKPVHDFLFFYHLEMARQYESGNARPPAKETPNLVVCERNAKPAAKEMPKPLSAKEYTGNIIIRNDKSGNRHFCVREQC